MLPSFHTRTDELTIMNANKRKSLEAAGWKFGSVAEFLELTAEEEAEVESKMVSRERLLHKEASKEESDDRLSSR